MRMSVDEFEMLTPAEFLYSYLGWCHHQTQLGHQAWEIARYSAYLNITFQQNPEDRLPMLELLPLPWEDAPEVQDIEITDEERRDRANELAKYLK